MIDFKNFASYGKVEIEVVKTRFGHLPGTYLVGDKIEYHHAYWMLVNKYANLLTLENFNHDNLSNESEHVEKRSSIGTSDSEAKNIETSDISRGEGISDRSSETEGDRISSLSGESGHEGDKKTKSKRGRKSKSSRSSKREEDPSEEVIESNGETADSPGDTTGGVSIEQTDPWE